MNVLRLSGFSSLAFVAVLTLAPLQARADPNALWRIVHDQCVPHIEAGEGAKPCETVYLSGGVPEGVAILKDLIGIAQMLAIPTRRVTGIEDPQMLEPDAPKVFADGWKGKAFVEARLSKHLPREAVALAINSQWARSQDQLHVHVDCVAESVSEVLAGYASAIDDRWRAMTEPLKGRKYFARRVDSADLEDVQPLRLLADGLGGQRRKWAPIVSPRSARPSTASRASSCSRTPFPWKAAATPKIYRITIAQLPILRHDLGRSTQGPSGARSKSSSLEGGAVFA